MKYCAKCGTQMPDDAVECPQCQPVTNYTPTPPKKQESPKKTSSKTIPLIITNIVISGLALISTIGGYFIVPTNNGSGTNNDNSQPNNNVFNTTCPEDEYGYHDWSPAKCTEPAQCYNCDAYRDDKLGEHSFYTDDDGFCDCSYCGILYTVYIASLD